MADLKLPKYDKTSLRPNPHTAEPSRGVFAFAQGSVLEGDFGDDGALVRPALGLPKTSRATAESQEDPTAAGFIPAPGRRSAGWPNKPSQKPRAKKA